MQDPFKPQDEVEQLLVEVWYPWSRSERPHLGVKPSSMFRDLPAERGAVYADADEREVRLNRIKAERIEWCIRRRTPTQQCLIDLHCANSTGPAVWRYPRMTQEEQDLGYQRAKSDMLPDLVAKELIEKVAA